MESRFEPPKVSQQSIFQPKPENIEAFKIHSFMEYLEAINPVFLKELQKSTFPNLNTDYTLTEFLASFPNPKMLTKNAITLLNNPFDPSSYTDENLSDWGSLPISDDLKLRIHCYIDVLMDVFENQLAQRPYEQEIDKENVTEREHGLEAGKYAFTLGLPMYDVLALLFHDIARPSVHNVEHGHKFHAQEGSTILTPLGLPTDYALHHTFAKFLLNKYCPPYQNLISPLSAHSLKLQTTDGFQGLDQLRQLNPKKLTETTYKIKFMRMLDDMSKIPISELLSKPEDIFFKNEFIKDRVIEQISMHLLKLCANSSDLEKTLEEYKGSLDEALKLLLRARGSTYGFGEDPEDFTSHPEIYEPYEGIINELRKHSVIPSLG